MELPHPVASLCSKVIHEVQTGFESSRVTPVFSKYQALREAFLEENRQCVKNGGDVSKLQPAYSDLMYGNPQEMPLKRMVELFHKHLEPQHTGWFAYNVEPPKDGIDAVLAHLKERVRIDFEPADMIYCSGAFPGLYTCLKTVIEPGDEVIYFRPCWFFYSSIIHGCHGVPISVPLAEKSFDLDLDALSKAITSKTRAVFLTNPHNPTGRIFSPAVLQKLSQLLTERSQQNGRAIYVISDEAYSRFILSGNEYHSILEYYPQSFLVYTFTKTLLNPGQRMGYVAINPRINHKNQVRAGLYSTHLTTCFAVPNNLILFSVADWEKERLMVALPAIEKRRAKVLDTLKQAGFEYVTSEGTFYLWVKSPVAREYAFIEALAEDNIFVLDGSSMEYPGYVRICLTATEWMVDRALASFAKAKAKVLA